MINNAALLADVDYRLNGDHTSMKSPPRRRVSPELCLPERLPSTAFLQREAETAAPKAILALLRRRSPSPPVENEEVEVETSSPTQRNRTVSESSSSSAAAVNRAKSTSFATSSQWREPQPYEVFRAVERKDIMFLMEIRDRAFHLLLRKTGDATPLLHAMRVGESHRDVAILLLGAFSRWVNHLQDEEVNKPRTRALLKALRTNLKLAIDYGLAKSQSDLISSFLQTLIMSEGERWIWSQTSNISLALRAGTEGKPVFTAASAVRKFATRELGKAALIASLEDYIANATADLLMLGAWSQVLEFVQGEQIPSYYFARDDKVYKAFLERAEIHKHDIQRSASKRLKWQIRLLRVVLEGRNITYHKKVETLQAELDDGEGV